LKCEEEEGVFVKGRRGEGRGRRRRKAFKIELVVG